MFRTCFMKAMDRAYEAQRLGETINRLQAKQRQSAEYRHNSTIAKCIGTADALKEEYKVGHEINQQMIQLVYETFQILLDDITVVSFPEIQCLSYLFLERLSFPGSDEPFIITVGGLYYDIFGRPMLSAVPQNVEILRQEGDETETAIGKLGADLLSLLRDAKDQFPEETNKTAFYFELTKILEETIKASRVPYATWDITKIFG